MIGALLVTGTLATHDHYVCEPACTNGTLCAKCNNNDYWNWASETPRYRDATPPPSVAPICSSRLNSDGICAPLPAVKEGTVFCPREFQDMGPNEAAKTIADGSYNNICDCGVRGCFDEPHSCECADAEACCEANGIGKGKRSALLIFSVVLNFTIIGFHIAALVALSKHGECGRAPCRKCGDCCAGCARAPCCGCIREDSGCCGSKGAALKLGAGVGGVSALACVILLAVRMKLDGKFPWQIISSGPFSLGLGLLGAIELALTYRLHNGQTCCAESSAAPPLAAVAVAPGGVAGGVVVVTPIHVTGSTMLQVIVPAGAVPGQLITVQAPNGAHVQMAVPQGVAPGQAFQCKYDEPVQAVVVVDAVVVST